MPKLASDNKQTPQPAGIACQGQIRLGGRFFKMSYAKQGLISHSIDYKKKITQTKR
jgi:hypothetical protein